MKRYYRVWLFFIRRYTIIVDWIFSKVCTNNTTKINDLRECVNTESESLRQVLFRLQGQVDSNTIGLRKIKKSIKKTNKQ